MALPRGATDAHCHVFGPADVFPYPPDRAFTPVDAPRDEVTGLQRFLGFQRAVFVQSAGHGTDHRPLLDALAADRANRRGVAILRPGIGTAEILRLDAAGVCGARLHFVTHLGPGPSRSRPCGCSGRWPISAGMPRSTSGPAASWSTPR
nr:amidohydrolase family protein [Actinomadura madurae]